MLVEFIYQGNGIYIVIFVLMVGIQYEFKFVLEDWVIVNFGVVDVVDVIVIDGVGVVLGVFNNNLFFIFLVDVIYLFIVDVSDVQVLVFIVENEEFYVGIIVYLCGVFNGWGIEMLFEYKGVCQYQVVMLLIVGSYEFKVVFEDWVIVNFGVFFGLDEDKMVELGQEIYLVVINDNLVINIDVDGDYVFIVDVSDKVELVFKVFNVQFFGVIFVYLCGGMNGWGIVDELVYQGVGVYLVDIIVSGGVMEFKVVLEDWVMINLGNLDDVLINIVMEGVGKVLGSSNNNLMIELFVGMYEFRVIGLDVI